LDEIPPFLYLMKEKENQKVDGWLHFQHDRLSMESFDPRNNQYTDPLAPKKLQEDEDGLSARSCG
jgi:hypothetical protein